MGIEGRTMEPLTKEWPEVRDPVAELGAMETKIAWVEELGPSLFLCSPIGIYVVRNGKFEFVNPQFERISGYSEDKLVGMESLQLVLSEDRNTVRENAVRMLRGERSRPYEYRMVNSAGEIVWSMETVTPIHYGGKRAVLGNFMDITERKRMEEELRSSQERLGVLFEYAPDAHYLNDLKGNFIDVNKAIEEMTGYGREELTGKKLFRTKLLPRKQIPKALALLARNALGQATGGDEFTLGRKDGKRVQVEISTVPVKIEGQPLVLGIARDITKRKRVEKALQRAHEERQELEALLQKRSDDLTRASRALQDETTERIRTEGLFQTLFDSSPIGSYIAQNGSLQLVNRRLRNLTGYGENELLRINPLRLVHPEDRKQVKTPSAKMMQGERFSPYEYRMVDKGGGTRWVMETDAEILYHGELATLGNIVDITERKRVEEALRRADEELEMLVQKRTAELAQASEALRSEISERKRAEEELRLSFEKLRRNLEETVNTLASAVEKRDPYTAGHQQRVAKLSCIIAREMNLPGDQINGLNLAAAIHDIGKIFIPAEILSKPGQLSEIEFSMITTHPHVGYDILKGIEFPWPVASIVLQHHERMDGSGYPQALAGEDVLIEARILAVADVVEAMASHRPYRPVLGIDQGLQEVLQNRGVLYDPQVVDACLRLFVEKAFQFE